ncbi:hypothetical protein DFR70_104659 [Nocardia tenerifensis]|uniref:Ava_C0101 and related proteins n=1 Tax=Nocardia tenerifensis TaxID=228006 RepID=A0A318K274_9NOCA|nr:DUF5996 family protein [Nocardia tenerifensis]PXX65594.1 hypothetical protein DFR70_104659 [Nocardia tenerifensis]
MTVSFDPLPAIPLESWRPTKETLHRFAQIVGKVALAKGVRRNHWWHMTYRLTARGWTTVPLGSARNGPVFTCAFDFFDHVLRIATDQGAQVEIDLVDQSVATFYGDVRNGLRDLDIEVTLAHPHPFDLPDARRPFEDDDEHRDYDPDRARHAFRVQSQVGRVLEEFSATYSGKISPVQLFWHTFDIAVQRFSPRHIELPETVDSVTREAYSREVISAGFWFGDDKVPEPTFYSYTAPEPAGLAERPLSPAGAHWVASGAGHSAYYPYDAARATEDPVGSAREFFQSVYANGAELAGWDTDQLTCWGGVTDPVLREKGWPEWPE